MPTSPSDARHHRCDTPACPQCGGLECLCRPRFFAGQLLSEEDLRALDHYIIEKNKLHNRHLHGWGVVCGLQVVCHECKGWVTIKQGYALDPCGNDVVVCEDQPFNLCAAIDACCAKRKTDWDCEPIAAMSPECDELPQCWYVTLRYVERPSRAITALHQPAAQPCCSTCGCGSGAAEAGCHCGCHGTNGHSHRSARTATTVRRPPAQCEPTRVCEGFVIEVAPAPPASPNERDPFAAFNGTFLGEWHECLTAIQEVMDQRPAQLAGTPEQIQQRCCAYKKLVWEFVRDHPQSRCTLLKELEAIRCPLPGRSSDPAGAGLDLNGTNQALDDVVSILKQLADDCRCLALLPRCPGPVCDPRVILACVTVQRQGADCRILDICHWHGRRTLLTWPNVSYWLSLGELLKQVLENRCCGRAPRPGADLSITRVSLEPNQNMFVACVIEVINNGPELANNVVLKATLAASNSTAILSPRPGVPFLPSGAWTNPTGSSFSARLSALGQGQSQVFSFSVDVRTPQATVITLLAEVSSDAEDPNPADNTNSAQTVVAP